MARRSSTSRKARALAATAGFALALTPAGLALADSGQATTPSAIEQPAPSSAGQAPALAPSSTTPVENAGAPANNSNVVSSPALGESTSPEGVSPSGNDNDSKITEPSDGNSKETPSADPAETPSQAQDPAQKVDEGQQTKGVKDGDEQSTKGNPTQTESETKEAAAAISNEQKSSEAADGSKKSEAKTDASAAPSQAHELEAQNRQAALKNVSIDAHVQNLGWTGAKSNQAGTTGQGLRMEAVRIKLVDEDGKEVNGVSYKAHVEGYGWMPWTNDGEIGGTTGQSLRIEAIKLALSDELSKQYDIVYRVHVQNLGWLDWTSNGAAAGTTGQSLRIESIGAYLQRKNAAKIGTGKASFIGVDSTGASVFLTSHVQNIGWSRQVEGMAGSTGQGLRLEAFTAKLDGVSGDISYKSHVQNVGWMGQVSNGAVTGTTGKEQRIEAASFVLSGEAAEKYDVYYRAHVQNYGWLGWSKNGEGLGVGTQGLARRMEALQIRLVAKGGAAPSNGDAYMNASFVAPVSVAYATTSGSGWTPQARDGQASANTAGDLLERMTATVSQTVNTKGTPTGGITYQMMNTNGNWMNAVANGAETGANGTDVRAFKVNLTGELGKAFDVYYRAHVNNKGWLGWASNGADAGTMLDSGINALAITLVAKGSPAPSNSDATYTDSMLSSNWRSNVIERYLNIAVGIANDNSHGYSQGNTRWGPDYDCSSLVITSLAQAGLPVGGATYTGNMIPELTKNGWVTVPYTSMDALQRGDILLNPNSHTEFYLGGGMNVAALISENGTIFGTPGDQTGREIMVRGFRTYKSNGWDIVLRLK